MFYGHDEKTGKVCRKEGNVKRTVLVGKEEGAA